MLGLFALLHVLILAQSLGLLKEPPRAHAALMGAFLIPFGLWAFGRAERYAKRTGKLKRVG